MPYIHISGIVFVCFTTKVYRNPLNANLGNLTSSLLIACLAQLLPPPAPLLQLWEMKESNVWRTSITWLSKGAQAAQAAQAARMIIRTVVFIIVEAANTTTQRIDSAGLQVCLCVCVCVITRFYWSNDSVDTPHKHVDLICSSNCRITLDVDRVFRAPCRERGEG